MHAPAKAKILVVEDEPSIQQVLCFFLNHNGFEVLGVSNGQDAIRAIAEFDPQLCHPGSDYASRFRLGCP